MPSPLPHGSPDIARWAAMSGLGYEAFPDEAWFRRWEPHDTIAPPSRFFNACTWQAQRGHVVLVEPWYAPDDADPLDRTVLAFAVHPGLSHRAAARAGEHFLTRVAFLESPPPPQVALGEPLWDAHVTTFASTPAIAAAAFHPRLRKLLAGWGFQGHLELRVGGLVLFYAGVPPTPAGYERLLASAKLLVEKAIPPSAR